MREPVLLGVDFTAFAKTDVNGANTHPVWHFLRCLFGDA